MKAIINFMIIGFILFISPSVRAIDFEFSPPPQAIDFHTQFEPRYENVSRLIELRKRTERFNIHPMAFYTTDVNGVAFRNNASWTSDEISRASAVLNGFKFKVSASINLGLSNSDACDPTKDPILAAVRAANFEIQALRRLTDRGIQLARIYVDGPMLMLLRGAKKGHSCGSKRGGRNMAEAALIVDRYFTELRNAFPTTELIYLINIVNWKQGALLPYYGTSEYELRDAMDSYLVNYKRQLSSTRAYRLGGFSFDAPWSVVQSNSENFKQRLSALNDQLKVSLGEPAVNEMTFSFIVNSKPRYHLTGLFFKHREVQTDKYSRLLSLEEMCARQFLNNDEYEGCLANGNQYFDDSARYADFIKGSVLSDSRFSNISKHEIQFGSWHDFPRESVVGQNSYASFVVSQIDRLDSGKIQQNLSSSLAVSILDRAISAPSCTPSFKEKQGALNLSPGLNSYFCFAKGYEEVSSGNCRRGEYLALRPDVRFSSFETDPYAHWLLFGRAVGMCRPSTN